MAERLLVRDENEVRILVLNRPDRANALDPILFDELELALAEVAGTSTVRAVVLTGSGERAFCAGADMRATVDADAAERSKPRALSQLFEAIQQLKQPVIAAINGAAIGGGFELALACDLRVAETHATFALPEAKRGAAAQVASTVLANMLPDAIALEMLLLGKEMSATEARQWGLLNRVCESGDSQALAISLASSIAENAPLSIERMKRHARLSRGIPVLDALRLNEGPDLQQSEDRMEGFRAFVEKRRPVWKGR